MATIEYHTKIKLLVPQNQLTDDEDVVNKEYVDELLKPLEEAAIKFTEQIIGDGTKTSFTINHKLDVDDVIVSVWDNNSHRQVFTEVTMTDKDNVEVAFAEAPSATGNYRIVVIG